MQIKNMMALLAAASLALSAVSVAAAPASGKAEKEKKGSKAPAKDEKAADPNAFGDWKMSCQTPQGASAEVCELTLLFVMMQQPPEGQAPAADAKGQLLLTAGVIRQPGSKLPSLVLRAPLGVPLQAPLLKVPGHKDVPLAYFRCDQNGCYTAPVGLEKEFTDATAATEAAIAKDPKAPGATITVMYLTSEAGGPANVPKNVTMPFSVRGFGKGLAALEKKVPAATVPAAKK
jgi:invasion protein IalB